MANKNKANSLVSNLLAGNTKRQAETTVDNTEQASSSPCRSVEAGCKEGDARTTFVLNKELVKKVKYIALKEGCSIKTKVTEGLTCIVDSWEAKNGEIKL